MIIDNLNLVFFLTDIQGMFPRNKPVILGIFSLMLYLPNAIRYWRIDLRRASEFFKYFEICLYLDVT